MKQATKELVVARENGTTFILVAKGSFLSEAEAAIVEDVFGEDHGLEDVEVDELVEDSHTARLAAEVRTAKKSAPRSRAKE